MKHGVQSQQTNKTLSTVTTDQQNTVQSQQTNKTWSTVTTDWKNITTAWKTSSTVTKWCNRLKKTEYSHNRLKTFTMDWKTLSSHNRCSRLKNSTVDTDWKTFTMDWKTLEYSHRRCNRLKNTKYSHNRLKKRYNHWHQQHSCMYVSQEALWHDAAVSEYT